MEFFKNIMDLTRAYTLPMTFASCCVIFSYAHFYFNFSYFDFFILLIAFCILQMAANLFDDYIDIKSKLNNGVKLEEIKFASARKAVLIKNKTFSINQVEMILSFLFLTASLIGAYFVLHSGAMILLFVLAGAVCLLFYPKSSSCCLSEIITGFVFGPLMINAGFYALIGEFNFNLFLLSIAIFFTTNVLLHTHNIMDWEFDVENNKKTFAILLKNKPNAITALKWMMIIPYLIVVFGVFNLNFSPRMLYVFFTLPVAARLQKSIKDYINIKDVKFIPKWYYGPFENWDKIKENKMDYFMYRFYLARNFALFFAIFASIGAMF